MRDRYGQPVRPVHKPFKQSACIWTHEYGWVKVPARGVINFGYTEEQK